MIIFLNRQGINISPEHYGFSWLCTFDNTYGTGNILKGYYLNAHLLEFFHNVLSSIDFLGA
jgi:hypothetical protein